MKSTLYKILCYLMVVCCFTNCRHKEIDESTVGIQPLDQVQKETVLLIKKAIETYYQCDVVVLPEKPIYKKAFVQIKTPRYRADQILEQFDKEIPDSIDYLLGFTHHDISTTKRDQWGRIKQPEEKYTDWGILGLAYCPGTVCVISDFRTRVKQNKAKSDDRIMKVALHELGHNFGLPHCPSEKCFMRDANESVKTIDEEALELCDPCKKKLNLSL